MTTLYVLIDYENVQPKDLSLLQGRQCRTLVFVGKNQKLAVECANALQPHLNARGIRARRCVDITSAVAPTSVVAEREKLLAAIVKDLRKRGDKRPRTERTLIRALVARFPAKLAPDTAIGFVEALQKKALIAVEDGRVAYKF